MKHLSRLASSILVVASLLGTSAAIAQTTAAPTPVASSPAAPKVGFSIIRTAGLKVREGLVFAGGSLSTEVDSVFAAVLVKHDDDHFLFDTGLGSDIDNQYRQDMPWHLRLLFKYEEPVVPARDQLKQSNLPPISRIILSHAHWDHASGITDFPNIPVYVSAEEMRDIVQAESKVGRPWPSQVGPKSIRWSTLKFSDSAYEGFVQSLDLYSDGKVVLVPLFGHTQGSVGMFVTVDSGKRYFFVGDVAWSAKAIALGSPKVWAARVQVDGDTDEVQRSIERIRAVQAAIPGLTVIPAHDGTVMNTLGYFPVWIR